MKFSSILALVATTQAVHLTVSQKTELKAQAEVMTTNMSELQSSMEESQKTLSEL